VTHAGPFSEEADARTRAGTPVGGTEGPGGVLGMLRKRSSPDPEGGERGRCMLCNRTPGISGAGGEWGNARRQDPPRGPCAKTPSSIIDPGARLVNFILGLLEGLGYDFCAAQDRKKLVENPRAQCIGDDAN